MSYSLKNDDVVVLYVVELMDFIYFTGFIYEC